MTDTDIAEKAIEFDKEKDILVDRLTEISEKLSGVNLLIKQAKDKFMAGGPPAEPAWFDRTRYARRKLKLARAYVQRDLTLLRTRRKEWMVAANKQRDEEKLAAMTPEEITAKAERKAAKKEAKQIAKNGMPNNGKVLTLQDVIDCL